MIPSLWWIAHAIIPTPTTLCSYVDLLSPLFQSPSHLPSPTRHHHHYIFIYTCGDIPPLHINIWHWLCLFRDYCYYYQYRCITLGIITVSILIIIPIDNKRITIIVNNNSMGIPMQLKFNSTQIDLHWLRTKLQFVHVRMVIGWFWSCPRNEMCVCVDNEALPVPIPSDCGWVLADRIPTTHSHAIRRH